MNEVRRVPDLTQFREEASRWTPPRPRRFPRRTAGLRPMENMMTDIQTPHPARRLFIGAAAALVTAVAVAGCGEGQAEGAPSLATADVVRRTCRSPPRPRVSSSPSVPSR
jgi:hypothetical protein